MHIIQLVSWCTGSSYVALWLAMLSLPRVNLADVNRLPVHQLLLIATDSLMCAHHYSCLHYVCTITQMGSVGKHQSFLVLAPSVTCSTEWCSAATVNSLHFFLKSFYCWSLLWSHYTSTGISKSGSSHSRVVVMGSTSLLCQYCCRCALSLSHTWWWLVYCFVRHAEWVWRHCAYCCNQPRTHWWCRNSHSGRC